MCSVCKCVCVSIWHWNSVYAHEFEINSNIPLLCSICFLSLLSLRKRMHAANARYLPLTNWPAVRSCRICPAAGTNGRCRFCILCVCGCIHAYPAQRRGVYARATGCQLCAVTGFLAAAQPHRLDVGTLPLLTLLSPAEWPLRSFLVLCLGKNLWIYLFVYSKHCRKYLLSHWQNNYCYVNVE